MTLNVRLGVEGHFSYTKGKQVDGKDIYRKQLLGHKNMVLDAGLTRMGTSSGYTNYIHLGSGTTPPQASNTTLENKLYSGADKKPGGAGVYDLKGINTSDPLNPYVWHKLIFRVNPQGINRTYTEVGAGWDVNNVTTRSLIKDALGNPTSISVLEDEYLDVTFEMRVYPPMGTRTQTITPTGDDTLDRTVTITAANVGTHSVSQGWYFNSQSIRGGVTNSNDVRIYNGSIQDNYSLPTGGVVGSTVAASRPLLTNTSSGYSFTIGLPDNIGTYRTFVLSTNMMCFQAEIDPPFVKTDEDKFQMGFTYSWGRR